MNTNRKPNLQTFTQAWYWSFKSNVDKMYTSKRIVFPFNISTFFLIVNLFLSRNVLNPLYPDKYLWWLLSIIITSILYKSTISIKIINIWCEALFVPTRLVNRPTDRQSEMRILVSVLKIYNTLRFVQYIIYIHLCTKWYHCWWIH